MDNKIILELIKKDLDEIRILVEALEQSTSDEQLLIDITTSKAKTLLDEISLLKVKNTNDTTTKDIENIVEIQNNEDIENQALIEEEVSLIENISDNNIQETKAVVTELKEEAIVSEPQPIEKEVLSDKVADEVISELQIPTNNYETELALNEEQTIEEEEVLDEEESIPEEIKTEEPQVKETKILGENFTKEPSLNERFASVNHLKAKIVGKPVTSIKGAIGINDKFMYSRELFDNNQEKLYATVETLDNASNLIEAVEYLEQNFKWQKNDVSLKFMELVKRRFENQTG